MAAALVLLPAGALWRAHDGELFGIPKTYGTAHGEQSVERLPDGSVLRLDTDSEATVRYSGRERLVELNRGQALFEVAHDSHGRFRVAAGNAGAIAVGTQFDVYRTTPCDRIHGCTGRNRGIQRGAIMAAQRGRPAAWGATRRSRLSTSLSEVRSRSKK